MKHETELNLQKNLKMNNDQFLRDFNRLIENFELKVQQKFGMIDTPNKVNRQAAGVINSKLADIKRCFPECPGYKR